MDAENEYLPIREGPKGAKGVRTLAFDSGGDVLSRAGLSSQITPPCSAPKAVGFLLPVGFGHIREKRQKKKREKKRWRIGRLTTDP